MIAPVFKSVGAKCSTVTFICHALRFSFVLGITSERRALPQVEIVSPGLQGSAALSSITLAGPAFESGVELLRMNYYRKFGVNHTFLFDNRIKDCAMLQGNVQNMLAEYYYAYLLKSKTSGTNGTVVIITPGCIEALFLNQMAAGWNILLITTTSSDVIIRDKDKSPTWINTNQYPSLYYGESFYQLLKMNNWTSVFVVTDESAVVYYSFVSRQTLSLLKLKHVHATSVTYSSKIEELNFDGLLEEFSRRSRIMLVFAQPPQLRKLLLAAHSKNMTNGEHVYIATQPFDHKIFGNFTWKSGDESDETVREAYASVFFVVMIDLRRHQTSEREILTRKWVSSYRTNPFFNNTDLHDQPPMPQLTATHAAMEILGQVLNETLSRNTDFDISNGRKLALEFVDRTYRTEVGPVTIDRYGDRQPSISVQYFDNEEGAFESFLYSTIDNGAFAWSQVAQPIWHGQHTLPANEPPCGFSMLAGGCIPENGGRKLETVYTLIALIVVMVVGLGITVIFVRYQAAKQALEGYWWRVDPDVLYTRKRRASHYFLSIAAYRLIDPTKVSGFSAFDKLRF